MQTVRMTRRERQEQTRANILDAGLGVFRQQGYARATIDQVAELAGCTRGTVYLHFGSKQGLFVAVVELHLEDQVADLRARVDAARTERRLLELLLTVVDPQTRRPTSLMDWAVVLADLHDGEPELLERARRVQAVIDGEVARLVQRLCQVRSVQPPADPRALAGLVLALGNGLAARAALDPRTDLRSELTTAVDLLLREHG